MRAPISFWASIMTNKPDKLAQQEPHMLFQTSAQVERSLGQPKTQSR